MLLLPKIFICMYIFIYLFILISTLAFFSEIKSTWNTRFKLEVDEKEKREEKELGPSPRLGRSQLLKCILPTMNKLQDSQSFVSSKEIRLI